MTALRRSAPRVEADEATASLQATGMTEEDGETLVWAEMSDGELWIDCCIPLAVVEEYNRCAWNSATQRRFCNYQGHKLMPVV